MRYGMIGRGRSFLEVRDLRTASWRKELAFVCEHVVEPSCQVSRNHEGGYGA